MGLNENLPAFRYQHLFETYMLKYFYAQKIPYEILKTVATRKKGPAKVEKNHNNEVSNVLHLDFQGQS